MSMLTITKERDGEKLVVLAEGWVDTATAPRLEKEVLPDLNGVRELVLDFHKVEYISSAGLRVVVAFDKTMVNENKGTFAVAGMNDKLQEIFRITGLLDSIQIIE